MNKKFIIKENKEIVNIIKNGVKNYSDFFIIYNIESKNEYNRYCISVSKKLGKAHIRNKIKRRIKDILMKNKMDLGKNYVIIVRKDAIAISYEELQNRLINQIKEI